MRESEGSGDKVLKTKGMRVQSSCYEVSLLIFTTKHIYGYEYIYTYILPLFIKEMTNALKKKERYY